MAGVQVLNVNARDPLQVESVSVIDADLGVGDRRLLVMSGIALVDWKYDSDELFRGETEVRLGVYAGNLDQWSAFVGLASIGNDDSAFVFAADTARVRLDGLANELVLHFNTAIMGEFSYLGRISYQVVATVVRVTPHIAGAIVLDRSFLSEVSIDQAQVADAFTIMANRVEHDAPAGGLPVERLIPMNPGRIIKVDAADRIFVAHYRIENPQMAFPLTVTVQPAGPLADVMGVVVGQVAGPRVFTLTGASPTMDGVNFLASKLRVA